MSHYTVYTVSMVYGRIYSNVNTHFIGSDIFKWDSQFDIPIPLLKLENGPKMLRIKIYSFLNFLYLYIYLVQ